MAKQTTSTGGGATVKRLFAELPVTVDGKTTLQGSFQPATDDNYYNSPYYKSHEKSVLAFRATPLPGIMKLANVLPGAIKGVTAKKQISFHVVGDTGATTEMKYQNAENVANMMEADLKAPNGPLFFFHLGDVIYNFGEEAYYYQQFYDAYRNYNAPIFAIPGNHDGMVYNAKMKSLAAFEENFCAATPAPAVNASNLVRYTMDQPGVYFTLEAPFVSIIGLYSNVLDGTPGGIIAPDGDHFTTVGTAQLDFLKGELARLKTLRATDKRAIILAVHHPPFSGDSKNGGSPLMVKVLTDAFNEAGLWPDAILSGHAHNYERFTWTVNGKQIPCIIAGSGGFNVTPIYNPPATYPYTITSTPGLVMNNYLPVYGYLQVTVDAVAQTLTLNFNSPGQTLPGKTYADTVTVNWP